LRAMLAKLGGRGRHANRGYLRGRGRATRLD